MEIKQFLRRIELKNYRNGKVVKLQFVKLSNLMMELEIKLTFSLPLCKDKKKLEIKQMEIKKFLWRIE